MKMVKVKDDEGTIWYVNPHEIESVMKLPRLKQTRINCIANGTFIDCVTPTKAIITQIEEGT